MTRVGTITGNKATRLVTKASWKLSKRLFDCNTEAVIQKSGRDRVGLAPLRSLGRQLSVAPEPVVPAR
jgi:hypothetical protein